MKDRYGKTVGFKEFFVRWGEGIQQVTTYQIAKINLIGGTLVLIGVVWGLVVTFYSHTWWLFTILSGSLFLSGTSMLSNVQRFFALKKLNQFQRRLKDGI